MAYKDIEVRRARHRERYHRRSAERRAKGLCPRCGKRPPEPGLGLCAGCNDKQNAKSRARDARLRAEGKPRRDRVKTRAYERERARRETAKRAAHGCCTRCGKHAPAPGRKSCEPCLEKGRVADRARYAAGKAAGLPYGGADPEVKRRASRAKSKRCQSVRIEAGTCIRCGARPPAEGGTTCQPCRDRRQAAEKRRYAERRAARLCTRCASPVFDGLSRCPRCNAIEQAGRNPERKNRQSRKLYARRRARGECTSCGAPAQGASRCAPCAERSYHGSQHFKGIPVWEPVYTVVELATGFEHGPFDDPADVALCLAFAKLSKDEIEVIRDGPVTGTFTAWA